MCNDKCPVCNAEIEPFDSEELCLGCGAVVDDDHLFKVNADGLTVHAEDRGDDGCEQIWLEVVLPEESAMRQVESGNIDKTSVWAN